LADTLVDTDTFSRYTAAAMQRAQYKQLGDGTIFGEIPRI